MNDYISKNIIVDTNLQDNSNSNSYDSLELNTYKYKKVPVYKMGWKFSSQSANVSRKVKITNTKSHLIKLDKILPTRYNIYEKFPEYFPNLLEQGDLDSCVPTCISMLYCYQSKRQHNYMSFSISRLFLYWHVRKIYNELSDDNGSRIIDCIKVLKNIGAPPEFVYPYDEKKVYIKPTENADKFSLYCKLLGFKEIDTLDIKKELIANNPVIFGIKVFTNFNSENAKKTGFINVPNLETDDLIGGHSAILVAFDDTTNLYTFINTWGNSWGDGGLGYIPYEYVNNPELADEFYVMSKVSNPLINFFNPVDEFKIDNYINQLNINNKYKNYSDNLLNKQIQLIKILLLSIILIIYNI
jgi:C1A family cysteine protease